MEEKKTTTPAAGSGKGLCIASLVCGIFSLVICWWGWLSVAGLILAIVAIVTSVLGKKQMPNGKDGKATAGLVCGIIGVVLSVICVSCVACTTCAAKAITDSIDDYNISLDDYDWD